MALTQSLTQITQNVQKMADVQGTAALQRHPLTDLYEYINRGLGALHRILTLAVPDQRTLASDTITTTNGISLYSLPADFDHLISIDLIANGAKTWLSSYEMNERPQLTDGTATYTGIPFTYRLRGDNIEYLPQPSGAYLSTLWYVPAATQLVNGGDVVDTISRLDEYVIAYAAKLVGAKDKNWDLVAECRTTMAELEGQIQTVARARDKNAPSRIVDESLSNRWGRRAPFPRRWR